MLVNSGASGMTENVLRPLPIESFELKDLSDKRLAIDIPRHSTLPFLSSKQIALRRKTQMTTDHHFLDRLKVSAAFHEEFKAPVTQGLLAAAPGRAGKGGGKSAEEISSLVLAAVVPVMGSAVGPEQPLVEAGLDSLGKRSFASDIHLVWFICCLHAEDVIIVVVPSSVSTKMSGTPFKAPHWRFAQR